MNIELKKYLSKENDLFFCRPNSSDEYVIKECYSPMYFKDYMNYNEEWLKIV